MFVKQLIDIHEIRYAPNAIMTYSSVVIRPAVGRSNFSAAADASGAKCSLLKIQRDSKRGTQFRTSIFPELYMVCE